MDIDGNLFEGHIDVKINLIAISMISRYMCILIGTFILVIYMDEALLGN